MARSLQSEAEHPQIAAELNRWDRTADDFCVARVDVVRKDGWIERWERRAVATDRLEHEPCEAGTEGCPIDHTAEGLYYGSCDTW